MKPEIDYIYNKLKQLRFEFKESDRKLFPNEYTFDYGLDRYVRVDGNDLYISKDTFKPLEEELEYADNCHNLEEEIGCPLEVRDRALKQEVIYYEENGKLLEVIAMTCGWSRYRKTKICTLNCLYESNYTTRVLSIKTSDYQKTWWLKADRSE